MLRIRRTLAQTKQWPPSSIRRSLSALAQEASATPSDAPRPSKPHSIYMWGTSKKGTVPLHLLLPDANNISSGVASAVGASKSMFSGDDAIIDHPMRLDLDPAKFIEGRAAEIENVFCGAAGTAFATADGKCYVIGSNKNGELGIPQSETLTPKLLDVPASVAKVSLGQNFSAVLTEQGDVYTFGYGGSLLNGMGMLGHGSMDSHPAPTLVQSLIEDGCFASDVHCGEYSMTVLTTEGEVLTCGSGSYGRLGNLETADQLYLEPVEMMAAEEVAQIAGGHAFSLALNGGGLIHAWGRNNEGQLGTGMGLAVDMYAMESIPRPIEGDLEGRTVVRIAAGHSHAAAVTRDGELFTWGMNVTHEPRLESSLLHAKIVDVACGQNYTLALDEEGRVYSMGKGKTGVLGLASTKSSGFPVLVEGIPAEERVVRMSCGWAHVACVTELKR